MYEILIKNFESGKTDRYLVNKYMLAVECERNILNVVIHKDITSVELEGLTAVIEEKIKELRKIASQSINSAYEVIDKTWKASDKTIDDLVRWWNSISALGELCDKTGRSPHEL
jgi:hypothetical protein